MQARSVQMLSKQRRTQAAQHASGLIAEMWTTDPRSARISMPAWRESGPLRGVEERILSGPLSLPVPRSAGR
jgi:hypothetical protein